MIGSAVAGGRLRFGPLITRPVSACGESGAQGVSDTFRKDTLRAVRRLKNELGLQRLGELARERIEPWFAAAVEDDTGACTRNSDRESIATFASRLADTERIRGHDLTRPPTAGLTRAASAGR